MERAPVETTRWGSLRLAPISSSRAGDITTLADSAIVLLELTACHGNSGFNSSLQCSAMRYGGRHLRVLYYSNPCLGIIVCYSARLCAMAADICPSNTIATLASGYKIVISRALGLSLIYQHCSLGRYAPSRPVLINQRQTSSP